MKLNETKGSPINIEGRFIHPHVKVPNALDQAQRDNGLIVVAGAGVSISPPSNLPSYKRLIKILSSEFNVSCNGKEKEVFLEEVCKIDNSRARQLIKELLTDKNSKPNDLHNDIIRLFSISQDIRIITLNYDTHFEKAANAFRPSNYMCRHYPTVPNENWFKGLYFAHGRIDRPLKDLVLNKTDFTRAYQLNDLSKLLVRIASNNTVLLIGCSLSDPMTDRLVEFMAKEKSVYALAPKDDRERWDERGVHHIPYPPTELRDKHQILVEAIGKWATEIQNR